MTLAILSLSGNLPVFNTWLINRVSGLIITRAVTFNNFDDYHHIHNYCLSGDCL